VATLPRKRAAAGVLFVDEAGRVLLVEPVYKQGWEFPGGVVSAEESPLAGAVREVTEELGLLMGGPLPLLVVDWVPPQGAVTESVVWLFDGGSLSGEQIASIRLPAEELRSYRFVDPAEASLLLPPLRGRRFAAALAARAEGVPVYLEDGQVPAGR
jgi:8-oxo-dGTP pyrophosphatase MutT (NUDIX family)